jgi:uncharacterized membrane protein YeaQ/YmgE (transglycosylase-associated protein family)
MCLELSKVTEPGKRVNDQQGETYMRDLCIFAVIGVLAGAASRLCYRDKKLINVVGTMLLGMTGALLGGLISWAIWREQVDGELSFGAILTSLFAAVFALGLWPWVAFVRGNSVTSIAAEKSTVSVGRLK